MPGGGPEAPVTSAELRAAFERPRAFVTTTAHYRLRLTLVLAGMLLLQLAYLLLLVLIAAMGGFGTAALWAAGVPRDLLTGTFLVGLPAAAAIAVLFLLKPVFSRRPQAPKPITVLREDEPILFEFVQHICNLLDAPEPSRILVDLQVNAAASIRGFRGLLPGQYDLTIGLPLAGCLAMPEFAGVVAHEVGHFSQHAGLRSYFMIERVQGWFERVAHERDRFDTWLDRLCKRRDIRLKAIGYCARLLVKASRKYLSFLMQISRRISCDFSRHMEFDADRREAAVVGAEVFADTFRRLADLNAATTVAWLWVNEARHIGVHPDDYLEVLRAGEEAIADGVLSIQRRARQKSRFDTHPSDEERIAAVREFAPNVRLEIPGKASRLFHDLHGICRRATLDAYDRMFGPCSGQRYVIPSLDAIARIEERREERAAAFAMFGYPLEFCARWFRLDCANPGEEAEVVGAKPKPEQFDYLERRNLAEYAALRIARCGVRVNPQTFGLQAGEVTVIEAAEAASRREWNALQQELRSRAHHVVERLRRLRTADMNADCAAAWTTYEALSRHQAELDEIRRLRHAETIARDNAGLFPAAVCANLLEDLSRSADAAIARILADSANLAGITSAGPQWSATFDGQLTLEAAAASDKPGILLDRAASLLSRALGQLCVAALKAEDVASQTA